MRTPIASKMAFAIAGASPIIWALASARRGQILAVEQNSLDNRQIAKTWNTISGHSAVQNLAILKFNGFEQRAS